MVNDKILRQWDSDLEIYCDRVVPKFQEKLKNESLNYSSILKKLYDLYILYSFIIDDKLTSLDDTFSSIMLFYGKASHAILGIYSCLKCGLVSESVILLRTIFEIYVNVKLILEKNIDERIKLWDDFRFISEWNNYKANLNLLSTGIITLEDFEGTFTPELIKDIESNYKNIKQNYHPKFPYHWAWKIFKDQLKGKNPNLKKICEHLNIELDYVKIYSTLSISTHVDPHISNLISEDQYISIAPIFSDKVSTLAKLTISYCSSILQSIVKYNDKVIGDELKSYLTYYKYNVYEDL